MGEMVAGVLVLIGAFVCASFSCWAACHGLQRGWRERHIIGFALSPAVIFIASVSAWGLLHG